MVDSVGHGMVMRNSMESARNARQELENMKQIAATGSTCGRKPDARIFSVARTYRILRKHVTSHAWQKTELARHPQRPFTLDYVERLFTDWSEIHGDRGFGDDLAIMCGMARFHGENVMVDRPSERP